MVQYGDLWLDFADPVKKYGAHIYIATVVMRCMCVCAIQLCSDPRTPPACGLRMQLRLQNSCPRTNSGAQVHTWNGGGIGIKITASQTRLLGCYLDYNFLQVLSPRTPSLFYIENTSVHRKGV